MIVQPHLPYSHRFNDIGFDEFQVRVYLRFFDVPWMVAEGGVNKTRI
jgi:hypothetical protein